MTKTADAGLESAENGNNSSSSKVVSELLLPNIENKFDFTRDYAAEEKSLSLRAPPDFNFARDVMEQWAVVERRQGHADLALWWVDDAGNERKFSFTEIVAESKKLANGLTEVAGVKKGDVVIVVLPRLYQWYIIALACIRSGFVMSPGTTMLSERDLEHRIEMSSATYVITDQDHCHRFDEAIDKVDRRKCAVRVKIEVAIGQDKSARPGWISYDSLVGDDIPAEHSCVPTGCRDPMFLSFTSGTTGLPKMVSLAHQYALGHYTTARYFFGLGPGDVSWVVTDPGWAKIFYAIFGAWLSRSCVFAPFKRGHSPNVAYDTIQLLKKYPINQFCAAPTLFRMMLLEKVPSADEIPHLRSCLSGGEPVNPEVIERWEQLTGLRIYEAYGQTETALIVCNPRGLPYRPSSMGRSLPSADVKIVDDKGNELPPFEEGYIALRVPDDPDKRPIGLFTEYLHSLEAMAKSFVDGGRYYLLGDKGYTDKDGYIYFIGRSDDVIIMAGYRIGPFEVESALLEHPAVAESAVVSSPDEVKGEIVKAFVVLRPEFKTKDKVVLTEELQVCCKEITAPYKYPRKVEFVDSLPKTVSGKIRRLELRSREWAGHRHEHLHPQ